MLVCSNIWGRRSTLFCEAHVNTTTIYNPIAPGLNGFSCSVLLTRIRGGGNLSHFIDASFCRCVNIASRNYCECKNGPSHQRVNRMRNRHHRMKLAIRTTFDNTPRYCGSEFFNQIGKRFRCRSSHGHRLELSRGNYRIGSHNRIPVVGACHYTNCDSGSTENERDSRCQRRVFSLGNWVIALNLLIDHINVCCGKTIADVSKCAIVIA